MEAESRWGGGTRTEELTLPGFQHDVCSAVQPMAVATRFLRSLPLNQFGLRWINPPLALAHPLEGGRVAVLAESLEETCAGLGEDGRRYRKLIVPVVASWPAIERDVLGPIGWPRHLAAMSQFGVRALPPASWTARRWFKTEAGRALWAGLAAHSVLPLETWGSSAIATVLGAAAHRAGWPMAEGGSQAIADAMVGYLRSLGGEVLIGQRVENLGEIEGAEIVMCDTSPEGLLRLAGDRLPAGYRAELHRYRRGAGVFKLDWALAGPIPWTAKECSRAGTVHLGGTLREIEASERSRSEPDQPFVLLAQPSLFDPTRAPEGRHTAWAYCHVPNGSTVDMTARIERQVERFAPGFGKLILARSAWGPRAMEAHNANLVGGDITGGNNTLKQMFLRPTWRRYGTPLKGVYLCSASTPPGGGVHGLCGYYAAKRALAEVGSSGG